MKSKLVNSLFVLFLIASLIVIAGCGGNKSSIPDSVFHSPLAVSKRAQKALKEADYETYQALLTRDISREEFRILAELSAPDDYSLEFVSQEFSPDGTKATVHLNLKMDGESTPTEQEFWKVSGKWKLVQ